jgi:hypothetical protein
MRVRWQRIMGAKRSAGRAGLLRAGLVVLGAAMFTGGLYAGSYRFLYWMIARTDYVGAMITSMLLDYLILIAAAILIISSFIAALAEVLLSDDLELLRASPLREESLFLDRLAVVWFETAWMPIAFVVPILLGFAKAWSRLITETPGAGVEPDLWALAWLIIVGLPALTLIPAAASSLVAILVGRYISANRLRDALIAAALIAGMGFYAGGQYLRVDRILSPEGVDNFIESMRGIDRGSIRWLPTDWLAHSLDLALHGDLAATGFYSDRGLAAQRTDKLLEDALKATGDQPWLRLGLEGLIYQRRRDGPPGLLESWRNLTAKLPFFNMRAPPPRPALWPPLALWVIGLIVAFLGCLVAGSGYQLAYGRAQIGRAIARTGGRSWIATGIRLIMQRMPRRIRPFMVKDALSFLRDPAQWTQALVIAGMIALSAWGFAAAADRTDLSELAEVLPYAKVALFGIGAWIGTLLTSAAAARLVFPLVSLEGEAFWMVRAAPVRMRDFLLAKLSLAMIPTLLLGVAMAWVVASALQFPNQLVILTLLMAILNALVTCCLGIGLGAALPDFRFVNFSQLVQGPGGILFIGLSMTYATVLTGFCASFVYMQARGVQTAQSAAMLLGIPAIIGILLALMALRVGLDRLAKITS